MVGVAPRTHRLRLVLLLDWHVDKEDLRAISGWSPVRFRVVISAHSAPPLRFTVHLALILVPMGSLDCAFRRRPQTPFWSP